MERDQPEAMNRGSIKVFLSYAHEDEVLLKTLETPLSLLKRQGIISTWKDRDITAGSEWNRPIDAQLDMVQIILLLVSPDFIASDYCYSVEMKRAMELHQPGEASVIPIILRPVDWQGCLLGNFRLFHKVLIPLPVVGGALQMKDSLTWPGRFEKL